MAVTVSTMEFEPYKGKPDKERLIATFRGGKTDRVPNFEILIEDKHVTKMPGEEEMNRTLGFVQEYIDAAKRTGIGVILAGGCLFQTLYEFVITMMNAIHKYGRY